MRKPALAALIAGTLLSINAYALDLLQVYQEALAHDAQYAAARAALQAGQETEIQARAGLLPTIGLGGTHTRRDVPTIGTIDNDSYAITLTQPLFRAANWQTYQQGKLSAQASEVQFALAQQDLILRVSQAYFTVLAAQDTLDSVQAQKAAITEQLAAARRNFEVGTATITDTHEAQARYDLVVAQEYAAQNELDIARASLQQIIGRPVASLSGLRPGVTLAPPEPARVDEWVQNAEQQSQGVLVRELALQIAQREIKRNRAGHLPTLDLEASRSYSDSSIVIPGSVNGTTDTIGVRWTVPLFTGFAVTSQVRQAIAEEDRARSELESARRNAALSARQAYLGVIASLAQVRALEAAEVSSNSALESNRLGYQVGVRINIDVLNAQQQLYATRRDLAQARYNVLVNSLRLKSAAGSLSEEDVAQVNRLLGAR